MGGVGGEPQDVAGREAPDGGVQKLHPPRPEVGGNQRPRFDPLGEDGGFPSGSGAGVETPAGPVHGKQPGHELRSRILNVNRALLEQARVPGVPARDPETAGGDGETLGFHAFLREPFPDLLEGQPPAHAQEDPGGTVAGFEPPPGALVSELPDIAVHHPVRVRQSGAQVKAPVAAGTGPRVVRPEVGAEDGVDETGRPGPGGSGGEGHGLVDRGAGRYPVQIAKLVEAEPERGAHREIEFGDRPARVGVEGVVEGPPPAQHPEDQLSREGPVTVARGLPVRVLQAGDQGIGAGRTGPLPGGFQPEENGEGGAPGRGSGARRWGGSLSGAPARLLAGRSGHFSGRRR